MNLNMSFRHMKSSDSIKSYTKEKSEKLKKYFRGKISLIWNFSSEKQNRIAHLHLLGKGINYFSEAMTDDLRASIDLVLDKIEKQVRKRKEIVKNHLHRNSEKAEREE